MRFYTLDSMRSKVGAALNENRAYLKAFQTPPNKVEDHRNSFDATDLHFRQGYPEALKEIKRLTEAMIADLPDLPKPKTRYEVSGARLDVARAAAGVPECFRRTVQRRQAPKVYTIACNRTYSGHTTADHVYNRGVMMCAFTEYVQRQLNIRVGITLLRYIAEHGTQRSYEIEIKRPEMPLDLNTLATTVCDHSFLSGVIFACSGMDYPSQKYGNPCDPPADITKRWDLYIPSTDNGNFETFESTMAFLRERVAMLRCAVAGLEYDPAAVTSRDYMKQGASNSAPAASPTPPPDAPPTPPPAPTKPKTRMPITARYTGKCGTCHKVIHKGDACDWDKATRLIHHIQC